MISFSLCEKGNVREENQDSVLVRETRTTGLYVVADGVGGSFDGGSASRLITERLSLLWDTYLSENKEYGFAEFFSQIEAELENINFHLWNKQSKNKSCSTVCVLFIKDGIYGIISSGDSRIYKFSKGSLLRLTHDDVCEIKERNKFGRIMSAVGGYETLEYSRATARLDHKDIFFLCSDGIYKFIDEEFLSDILKKLSRKLISKEKETEASAFKIKEEAENNKTNDNYSLIIVKV